MAAHEDTPRDDRYTAHFCDEEGKAHIAVLAHDLRKHPEPRQRWAAADELTRLGLEVGMMGSQAFSEALKDEDADGSLRIQASKSLGNLGPVAGDIGARALAIQLLTTENEMFLRSSIAASLGKLSADAGQVGVLALGRAAEMDKDVVVRRQAVMSLGEIGPNTGARAADKAAVPALVKALGDSDTGVRWCAADAVGALGSLAGDAGAEALAKALREDKDVGMRRRAALSLGLLGATAGASAAALLYASRNDTHDIVRAQALDSMCQVRDASISTLLRLPGQEHEYVRGRAACAIGHLEDLAGEEAIAVLVTALSLEPETHVRRRVVEALGKIGKPVGDLGAAGLARARSDTDILVSCNAGIIYDELGIEPTEAGIAALDKMLLDDKVLTMSRHAEAEAAASCAGTDAELRCLEADVDAGGAATHQQEGDADAG